MRIHTIQPAPGAVTSPKRLGRGTGSGLGKTSGKGHKGQWARSGGVRIGFEGGQMPLTRRLPKRGFTNNWRKEYSVINIGDLECFDNGATVTPELIFEMGLAADKGNAGLKVLSDGTLTKQLTVKAHKFSKSAIANIEKAGGKAEVIE